MQPKRQYGFVPHDTTGATAGTQYSPLGYVYSQVPRFFVQLDVRDEEEFIRTLNTLYDAKWLDLKTRIIYLDINFFNPSTHALAAMRVAVELPITGGAYAACTGTGRVRDRWGGRVAVIRTGGVRTRGLGRCAPPWQMTINSHRKNASAMA